MIQNKGRVPLLNKLISTQGLLGQRSLGVSNSTLNLYKRFEDPVEGNGPTYHLSTIPGCLGPQMFRCLPIHTSTLRESFIEFLETLRTGFRKRGIEIDPSE